MKPSAGLGGQSGAERDKGWGDATGRVNLRYIPLKSLLLHVYGLQEHQLVGPPWLGTETLDIFATVPVGTPKERIPLMFQSMLAERFGLKFHKEVRLSPAYALVVAEGGPKLEKALPEDALGSDWATGPPRLTGSGENKAISGTISGPYGRIRVTSRGKAGVRDEIAGITMDGLARYLTESDVDLPVVNMTGLTGSYRLTMDVAFEELPSQRNSAPASQGDADQTVPSASEPGGPSVRESLRKVGLRLVSRKLPIEMFVVDHIERTPTEN